MSSLTIQKPVVTTSVNRVGIETQNTGWVRYSRGYKGVLDRVTFATIGFTRVC